MSLVTLLTNKLAEYHLLTGSKCLTVAYSGGVDSHVLLHLCSELRHAYPQLELKAIHVNHGISDNADDWQQHCVSVCAGLNIPLLVKKVRVEKTSRQSLEALAREERYQAFQQTLTEKEVLLLGQHQQDQAETLLLQLKRGAGPKGLSAMPEWGLLPWNAASSNIHCLRPLLQVDKSQILEYAKLHGLQWVEDESNTDTQYDRNFLRQQVLPLLEQRWQGFSAALGRSARLCAEQQALLDEQADEFIGDLGSKANALNIEALLSHSLAWQKQILRRWISVLSQQNTDLAMPSEKQLQHIIADVLSAADDANPVVVAGEWQYRRYQGHLYLLPVFQDLKHIELHWTSSENESEPLQLPDGLGHYYLSTARPDIEQATYLPLVNPDAHKICVRFSGFGIRFKLRHHSMSKPLKQWFKEEWKLPPWERERLPLLFVDEQLVAVGNRWIAHDDVFASLNHLDVSESQVADRNKGGIWFYWQSFA
ncbi:tRNA lysidine(34) synthetase TilS [Paraneptunicella aestuarii]|uniref:tRNA lysidine(34) synthetase TilS n=1 Tax=Paraneptunicella aestuarii TaxID=2831148 RepID=UPI001E3CD985|nr:tRNA lysidine(34) synthetase TilS [Paraneptunicella aestuarii]UAA39722.1 tRNA lysidine(34) synthetase TilS [Paraneptunicella aestuarii]